MLRDLGGTCVRLRSKRGIFIFRRNIFRLKSTLYIQIYTVFCRSTLLYIYMLCHYIGEVSIGIYVKSREQKKYGESPDPSSIDTSRSLVLSSISIRQVVAGFKMVIKKKFFKGDPFFFFYSLYCGWYEHGEFLFEDFNFGSFTLRQRKMYRILEFNK